MTWRESTPNSHFLDFSDVLKVEVYRNRSWKRLDDPFPWRIKLFGDPFVMSDQSWSDLDEAKVVAKQAGLEHLRQVCRAIR